MPEHQHAGFEEQVRALYDSMVRIEVTPTRARHRTVGLGRSVPLGSPNSRVIVGWTPTVSAR